MLHIFWTTISSLHFIFAWTKCLLHYYKLYTVRAITLRPDEIQDINELSLIGFGSENSSSLTIDEWKGTVSGSNLDSQVKRDVCPGNDDYCEKIPATPSVNITLWKNKQFKIKVDDSYYSYGNLFNNSVPSNEECPSDKKQCGILDTMNNKMCIDKDKECPINMIIHSNTRPTEYHYKFNNISLNDESYLFFTNEAIDNYIVAHFKISDKEVCLDPNEFNSDAQHYPLDYYEYYGCKTEIKGVKYNSNYHYLDTMNKFTFLEENGVIKEVEDLPYYPINDYKYTTTSLYYRTFIGYDKKCLIDNHININEVSYYIKKLTTVDSIFYAIFWLEILDIIVGLAQLMILCFENDSKCYFTIVFAICVLLFYARLFYLFLEV